MEESFMTDPTGRTFLSYRRARSAEAALLIAAQHDLGVPTWQDIQDLAELPTEEAIREVLGGDEVGSAVLWLTPEVGTSDMIQRAEAPVLVERLRRRDGFFLVPVAAGGLDFAGAAATLDTRFTLEDLARYNLRKVDRDPIVAEDAAEVASRVLANRISAVHRSLPAEAPLKLRLNTRVPLPFERGVALALDWTGRFDGRLAKTEAWDRFLLPALHTVSDTVVRQAPGRGVEAAGFCSIPAATALGSAFLTTRPTPISWVQRTEGKDGVVVEQKWSLSCPRKGSGFEVKCRPDDLGGSDLAVLVSVADEVEPAFAGYRGMLPRMRAILCVQKPGATRNVLEDAGHVSDIAYILRTGIREARQQFRGIHGIHLFMAVPLGLAMMIGQLLNSLGPVQTYERTAEDKAQPYHPAALLRPDA
jgi:hypothetical protein